MTKSEMAKRNKEEIELYDTKFFDYRIVSPDVATMQFMHAYAKSMETYNDMLGFSRHRHVLKAFSSMTIEELRAQQQFKQLASLRRWSDQYGMQYPVYWSYATEAHLKLKFNKTFITVFANSSIKERVRAMWDAWRESVLPRSESPFFKAKNFRGHAIQCEYYDYIIAGTLKRHQSHDAAARLSAFVRNGELDADYLKGYFRRTA